MMSWDSSVSQELWKQLISFQGETKAGTGTVCNRKEAIVAEVSVDHDHDRIQSKSQAQN